MQSIISSFSNSQTNYDSSIESKAWDEVVKVLQAKGLLNNFNVSWSPLYAVVLLADLELCKRIVEIGFPINRLGIHFSETPLYQAIYPGREEIALYLIEKGADVRVTDPFGSSYLHLAVEHSLPQVVDALIQGGAFVNAQVAIAFPHSDLTCAKYTGAPEEPYVVVTPLYLALRQDGKANNQQIAVALIKNGADIGYRGPNGFNFLHLAADKGYEEVCKLLVEKGMDVNTICDNNAGPSEVWKTTPLHFSNWGYNQELNKFYRIKKNEIDYYRIGDMLGSGGTAKVYALISENALKKIKAIKISNPNFIPNSSNSKLEKEFKEFKILQTLPSSEGVQKRAKAFFILSGFEAQSGIIMSKYDGTLLDLDSKMNPTMMLEAMRQLILGLKALHNEGIYSIDIKLDNIFFRSKEGKIHYVLADYGITIENKEFGIAFGIEKLGKAFKHMILGYLNAYKMKQITNEDVREKGLPDSVADLINYMIDSAQRDMQTVLKLFSRCSL